MNQIPNIEETNTREIEDKLEKLESIILLRVDRLFFEGTVILLKDYKETLAQQIRAELHHQLQKARQEGYKLAVKHLKEAYAANGATTVPEAIEWLEDNSRYQAELN